MLEHKHFIASGKCNRMFHSPEILEDWVVRLIDALNMQVLYGPFSMYCDIPGNKGITSVTLLTTSHIIIHIFEEENYSEIQLDVYSCSNIDLEVVFSFLKELDIFNVSYKFLDRETDLTDKIF